jgi:single-strand DNA-binding protein
MSALNLNKVILSGHLAATPELRQTGSGVYTTTFDIAVNRRFESNGRREVDFLTIVAWRSTAEFICRYFEKGTAICVAGSIRTRKWQDKEGRNRTSVEIVADEAYFVDGKTGDQSQKDAQNEFSRLSAPISQDPVAPRFEAVSNDDDLPF